MTALGGDLADYAEADVVGIVEWRDRAIAEQYAGYALRYLFGVVAPEVQPMVNDMLADLGLMTATLPPATCTSG